MRDLVEQVPINCITLEKLEEEKHKYIGQQWQTEIYRNFQHRFQFGISTWNFKPNSGKQVLSN